MYCFALCLLHQLSYNCTTTSVKSTHIKTHNNETYLQVVGDEQLSEVVHLQHSGGVVLTDAVTLQQVLGGHHLPGQPAQVEGRVARQHVGQVTRLAAAARIVFLHALCDGLHLSLLAVCTCDGGRWR